MLDSPLNNAMAHFVNLALFMLGHQEHDSAGVRSVTGTLCRARAELENFDICSLRADLEGGVEFVATLAHAVDLSIDPSLQIDTDRGTLCISYDGTATWQPEGGETSVIAAPEPAHPHMARALGPLSRGYRPHPAATLANTRPHAVLVSSISQAAAIQSPSPGAVTINADGVALVEGLAEAAQAAHAQRKALHEVAFAPAGQPLTTGSLANLEDYRHFAGPAE